MGAPRRAERRDRSPALPLLPAPRSRIRGRVASLALLLTGIALSAGTPVAAAQSDDLLHLIRRDGPALSFPIRPGPGGGGIPLAALEAESLASRQEGGAIRLDIGEGALFLSETSPFVLLGDGILQMTRPAWREDDVLLLPIQLFRDLLPGRIPGVTLRSGELHVSEGEAPPQTEPARISPSASAPPERRVVVIDPGHGGDEPGAIGASRSREKDFSLALGRVLAAELRKDPTLEVYMTREEDVFVPLWMRGEEATRAKGDRHGVFLSLHANSVPDRRPVRGFETYFLAEARTDDARRVAAIENAPLNRPEEREGGGGDPALTGILNELRRLDHQHWSALLAEFVQQELAGFHPGPNRGVKQAPFAVLTNALMPSVLIEVGFISNPDEERLLNRRDFQEEAAGAIGRAVQRFFVRYPPGGTTAER